MIKMVKIKCIYLVSFYLRINNRWYVCNRDYLDSVMIKSHIKNIKKEIGDNKYKYKIEQFKVVKGGNVKWN